MYSHFLKPNHIKKRFKHIKRNGEKQVSQDLLKIKFLNIFSRLNKHQRLEYIFLNGDHL